MGPRSRLWWLEVGSAPYICARPLCPLSPHTGHCSGPGAGTATGSRWPVTLVMFGTKLGARKGQCSGLPAPWYLSLTPGALPHCPPERQYAPERTLKHGRYPHHSLPGAEHGEGTRLARGWHCPLPLPLFTAISMSSSPTPTPRIVVWIKSKFTSRHPWGSGQG